MATTFDLTLNAAGATVLAEPPPVLLSESGSLAVKMPVLIAAKILAAAALPTRGTDDEVNRFLLCSLVSKSAKHIKEKGEHCGERLATKSIVKSVLRCYNLAAKQSPGLLAGSEAHLPSLRKLNVIILREQIEASVKDRVKNSQQRLDRATRLGDPVKIESEKEALAKDKADYTRLTGETGPHSYS